jgi:hypothetical protein
LKPPLAIFLGFLTTFLPARASLAATTEQVQSAIGNAKAFLYSQRNAKGNWETSVAPEPGKTVYDTSGGQWGGLTSLATYALLAAGENPRDARLSGAIDFLRAVDIRGVYALGLRSQVWQYLPPDPSLHALIERDGRLLLNGVKTYPGGAGMYGYLADANQTDADHPFDHSVSQYGVLGMWSLQEMGLEVPDKYWSLVDSAWRRDQLPDGSWSYFPHPQNAWPPSVSLTAAGVASLFITDDYLRASGGLQCRDDLNDADINRGLSWISDHFNSIFDTPNRPCYALYGIERIGAASGRISFGGKRWFETGADFLIEHQQTNGAWDQKDGEVADTALGLLFLARGRAPVVMNKLDYSGSSAAAWDRRPADASHLTRWISKTLEARRPLNWQVAELSGNPDDWHEAPILYVCGRDALKFTEEQESKLRRFIEDGGLILFNADCAAGKPFADSVHEMARRWYGHDFRELPADHPIYVNEEFHRNTWTRKPSVLGLSNGARELMLLIPDADLSAAWQVNGPQTHPEAFDLGANIFLYAVDKEDLRLKGESYLIKADSSAATKTIKLARLNYAPGWNPEPGGWRRLAAFMHNRDGVDLNISEIAPGNASLSAGNFNVAHLTGAEKFSLTDAQRADIAAFVNNGGTLIIDAAGGSKPFADSARTELAKIFGERAADLDTPLKLNNPVYSKGDQRVRLGDIRFRTFARLTLNNVRSPHLRGITIDGQTRVFFSPEDISVGLVGQPVDGIVGYEPELAAKLMAQLILGAAAAP